MQISIFRKKCELCGKKLDKSKIVKEFVKVPEHNGLIERPFCSKKHANTYKICVTGTKRTSFCPTCPI